MGMLKRWGQGDHQKLKKLSKPNDALCQRNKMKLKGSPMARAVVT